MQLYIYTVLKAETKEVDPCNGETGLNVPDDAILSRKI